jgi:predicted RecB family nuclease
MSKKILSKSKLMQGLQCEKLLWLSLNEPELQTEVSDSQQMQFDEGNEVGELARKLEGKGVMIDNEYWDYVGAAKKTQEYIENGEKLIFEAAFLKDDLFFRADILKKTKKGWHLIEVKKSTSVKPEYIQDTAIQTFIIESSGIKLESINLRHINNEMVYPDFSNFFETVDITEEVRAELANIKKEISSLKKTIKETKEPKMPIGEHCSSPYECAYKEHCWKKVPDFSVFDLPSMKSDTKWEHYNKKIIKIDQLDAGKFKGATKRAIEVTQSGKTFADKKEIAAELKQWIWPLYFFDFETINPAVPKFKGISPYNQMPFQYSCHVWKDEKDKTLSHFEFLHTENSDPRESLIKAMLKHLGKKGSIVAYNKTFEITAIKKLAEFDKKNSDALMALTERFVDPLPIFRSHVYHPEFRGSFSIKSVAPALIGEKLNYDNLEIGDGLTAQLMASLVMFGKPDKKEKEKIIQDLLIYCKQDTQAMVDIVKWLMKV